MTRRFKGLVENIKDIKNLEIGLVGRFIYWLKIKTDYMVLWPLTNEIISIAEWDNRMDALIQSK